MLELIDFEEFKKRMHSPEPMILGAGVDLASTDLGVTSGRTVIEVPMFKKPFKRRLKELFEKIF